MLTFIAKLGEMSRKGASVAEMLDAIQDRHPHVIDFEAVPAGGDGASPDCGASDVGGRFPVGNPAEFLVSCRRPDELPDEYLRSLCHILSDGVDLSRARLSLTRSQSHLMLLLDSVPALVSYLDQELVYRYCNSGYTEWFGIERERIIGCSVYEVLGNDAVSSIQEEFDAALAGNKVTFERRVPYRHGGSRDVLCHYIPYIDATGVAGLFAIVQDVTMIKSREHQLRNLNENLERRVSEEANRFEMLSNNVPAFFSFIDTDLIYRFVNGKHPREFGRPRSEFISHKVEEVLGEKNFRRIGPRLQAALGGLQQVFETPLTMPDSREMIVRARCVPHRDKNQVITGIFLLASDITAERRLESAAIEAGEREKSRVGRDIHDSLCQELGGIALLAKALETTLQRAKQPQATQLGFLVECIQGASEQARRIALGLAPIGLDCLSLRTALERHFNVLRELHPQTSFELVLSFDTRILNEGFAGQLFLICREALSNAVRHANAGRISLAISRDRGGLTLQVEDDGDGCLSSIHDSSGLGVGSITYRSKHLGGQAIWSQAKGDHGVRLVCDFPDVPALT